ncbi:TerB family tellurite resistance protein [Spongiibacter sp. KMU-166]|uniref:TerB family tellurite resistance protein n=1 Tax=Spongiibacter thalassae TaxID=2721624 RepID=A0ABX1GFG0_9GAMM|nr:TerB family tellurite resistance protein [Spongiibacter thalassae]NKI17178.1 TerB family tellurite resistance protein [Spongiibacter thalassae]
MLDFLKQLFDADSADTQAEDITAELAAAALLLEVSKSDYEQHAQELTKIRHLMAQRYRVEPATLDEFMQRAEQRSADSTSLYPFTRYINDNCNNEEKYALVKALWEVAAVDGVIDKYEEHLIRKISDLIYLPHTDYIRAKLSATGH